MGQRLWESTHASNQKQLIETSLSIIECTGILVHNLVQEYSDITQVLDKLYSLLSSKAFVIVRPDLQTLVCKIFIILDEYLLFMKPGPPDIHFYSVAYQYYLHSPVGGGKSSENDVMPHALECLISSSLNLPPASSVDNSKSHETPLNLSHYPLFSIDGLFQVMLLLIKEHNESVLYEWVRHPDMQYVWPECLLQLVRWASGEEFRQWDSLKRVLAIVVIGKLQNKLGHGGGNNESLPKYYSDACTGVNQPHWLQEIFSSR